MTPLTDWDNAKLSVILPLLSTVLYSNSIDSKSDRTSLELMCPYLVDYSLDKDNSSSSSRWAATSCVFSIVSNEVKGDEVGIKDEKKDAITDTLEYGESQNDAEEEKASVESTYNTLTPTTEEQSIGESLTIVDGEQEDNDLRLGDVGQFSHHEKGKNDFAGQTAE